MWVWTCGGQLSGKLEAVAYLLRGVNGCQTVPRAELQAFLCFLQRTKGPATYFCDAMAVSKGFRRLREGQNNASRTNQDLWSAIREAAKQRDIDVLWAASHEESKIDRVDATMAWFIGLKHARRWSRPGGSRDVRFP